MDPVLSATAVAQNTAFIEAIKNTETVRDKPLQITRRIGGGITIEGYRSVRFSKLLPLFMQYGKKFTITFAPSQSLPVKIDCFELVEHIIPTNIDNIAGRSKFSDVLCVILNGEMIEGIQSGAIQSFSFSLNKLEFKTALSIYQHLSVLDIILWPNKITVETIKQSDNKGGLSYLVQTKPEVFRRKCLQNQQRKVIPFRPSTKRTRVLKKIATQPKKSFFAFLH